MEFRLLDHAAVGSERRPARVPSVQVRLDRRAFGLGIGVELPQPCPVREVLAVVECAEADLAGDDLEECLASPPILGSVIEVNGLPAANAAPPEVEEQLPV